MQNKSEIINKDIHDSIIINQVNQILPKSYQYNDLHDQLKTQQKLFDLLPADDTEERLKVSRKINELTDFIEQFKKDILQLAQAFQNIEINTDRLKRAKEFFDKGEFGEARAVLETEIEQMRDEQTHLLREKEHFEQDVLPNLINNAEEFYLLAMTTRTDYGNPNRYEDTCKYFEDSIKSHTTKDNVFNYAKFLQEHNQFKEADDYYSLYLANFANAISQYEYAAALNNLALLHKTQNAPDKALKEYEEALQICRALAKIDSSEYLPDVARTLNNLALLHHNQNNYDESLSEYKETLQIYRVLAKTNPSEYLPDVARTLNNLANLHHDQNNYDESLSEYKEALQIRRALVEDNLNIYLPNIANTLNNLANLHQALNFYNEALEEYTESLHINRTLAEINPNTYLPSVAMNLINLAILHQDQNNYDKALKEFEEGLQLYRTLAEVYPLVYLPYLARTLNNYAGLHFVKNEFEYLMQKAEESTEIYLELVKINFQAYFPHLAANYSNLAVFYQVKLQNKEKSIDYAINTIYMLLPYVDKTPFIQENFAIALEILRDWNLSDEEVDKMIEEKAKEAEEDKD